MIDIAIGAGLTGGLVVLSISLVIMVYNFVASKIAPTTLENNVIQERRKKELQDKERTMLVFNTFSFGSFEVPRCQARTKRSFHLFSAL